MKRKRDILGSWRSTRPNTHNVHCNGESILIMVSTTEAVGGFMMERRRAHDVRRIAKHMNLEPLLGFLLAVDEDFL